MAVAAGIFVFAVWYLRICNSSKRQVGKLIGTMVALPEKVSGGTAESGILNLAAVDDIFAEQLVVRSSRKDFDRTFSHEDIRAMLMFLKKNALQTTVKTANMEIFITGENMALFNFEAEVTVVSRYDGRTVEVLLVSGSAEKISGKWRISAITAESAVQR